MKSTVIFTLIFTLMYSSTFAGALIRIDDQTARIGTFTKESNGKIGSKEQYGKLYYSKKLLLWYTTSEKVNTYYKAGRAAEKEDRLKVAAIFYKAEMQTRGKNAVKAKIRLLNLAN